MCTCQTHAAMSCRSAGRSLELHTACACQATSAAHAATSLAGVPESQCSHLNRAAKQRQAVLVDAWPCRTGASRAERRHIRLGCRKLYDIPAQTIIPVSRAWRLMPHCRATTCRAFRNKSVCDARAFACVLGPDQPGQSGHGSPACRQRLCRSASEGATPYWGRSAGVEDVLCVRGGMPSLSLLRRCAEEAPQSHNGGNAWEPDEACQQPHAEAIIGMGSIDTDVRRVTKISSSRH